MRSPEHDAARRAIEVFVEAVRNNDFDHELVAGVAFLLDEDGNLGWESPGELEHILATQMDLVVPLATGSGKRVMLPRSVQRGITEAIMSGGLGHFIDRANETDRPRE